MKYQDVLEELQSNKLSIDEAFKKIYQPKKIKLGRRATFIKLNIYIPDEGKKLNLFLKILFIIPFPIIFARLGLKIGQRFIKNDEIDIKEISKIIKYSKGTKIQVDATDAIIDIKII